MSSYDYFRRPTWEVNVGGIPMGGSNPLRVQSMTNTSTMDTVGSIEQCCAIADAGADYVRLTAQGVREADNIGVIRSALRAKGYQTPLVADIHFNPRAAFAAAKCTDKVRINPGNFIDPGRTFKKLTYTDEEYAAELERIDEAFTPFLAECRDNGTAVRIGVNHGSLSDRIMSRYGDTPAGMVESAMEFLRVAVKREFKDIVISIKASNVVVMVSTVRLLVEAMGREQMAFPLHLGVTEAGDGEDGRVKSAVGIGSLLADGIGDTLRVSLSEAPEAEVPVARVLVDYITSRAGAPPIEGERPASYNPIAPQRRLSEAVGRVGGKCQPAVIAPGEVELAPSEYIVVDAACPHAKSIAAAKDAVGRVIVVTTSHPNAPASIMALADALAAAGIVNPVVPMIDYGDAPLDLLTIMASADFGSLLLGGLRDGIWIRGSQLDGQSFLRLSLAILQATRLRISKTEYIACPGCGRTLFDLHSTLQDVKRATAHLKGLKIGVMGCIVNGPGEMADADYGYVGAASGRVSLYKGRECVEKNIPQDEALPRLIELIRQCGDWRDPEY